MIYCKGKRGLEVGSLVNSQAAILVQLTKQYFYLFFLFLMLAGISSLTSILFIPFKMYDLPYCAPQNLTNLFLMIQFTTFTKWVIFFHYLFFLYDLMSLSYLPSVMKVPSNVQRWQGKPCSLKYWSCLTLGQNLVNCITSPAFQR